MTEKFSFEKPPLEKEQTLEKVLSMEKLSKDFADELKKPHQGSFFKKLQRIGAAFILSGLAVFGSVEKANAPQLSKNFLTWAGFKSLKFDCEENIRAFNLLVEAIEEKGGIEISPEAPDTIFKPLSLAGQVRKGAERKTLLEETPYFSKPEIILGKNFIENNPQKAEKYLAKINKTIKSTTLVRADGKKGGEIGTGVIVNTAKGPFVLTAEHILRHPIISIQFADTSILQGKIVAKNKKNDLALLEIILPDCRSQQENANAKEFFLKTRDIQPLSVEANPTARPDDDYALVGNPYGFPNEVSLAKPAGISNEEVSFPKDPLKKQMHVVWSVPDERFKHLAFFQKQTEKITSGAFFHNKGELIPGMSGGPVINLSDPNEEPKVIAINTFFREMPQKENIKSPISNAGVSGKDIQSFLIKNNF